jgi:DNA-binding SARP family transcriptional activator
VRASRLEADLQLGRHTAVLGELEEAVRVRPLDEARWGRLALARYRSGQQAEALAALAEARRTLVDELGVEPGQALRDLELAVLRQDPALEDGRVTTTAAGEPAADVRPTSRRPARSWAATASSPR